MPTSLKSRVACPARVTDNLIQQPAMAACDVSQPLSVDTLLTAPPLGCDVLTVLSLLFAFLLPQKYNSCVLLHVPLLCEAAAAGRPVIAEAADPYRQVF